MLFDLQENQGMMELKVDQKDGALCRLQFLLTLPNRVELSL